MYTVAAKTEKLVVKVCTAERAFANVSDLAS